MLGSSGFGTIAFGELVADLATITGTLAKTNANDTVSAVGTTTVIGTLAKTNANDTCSASGSTGLSTITGTLATTNANDTSSASGTTTVIGAVAKLNSNDTGAASGTTTVLGTLAKTNANDLLSSSGWAGIITGTVSVVNGNDAVFARGSGGNIVASVPSGGYEGDFSGHPYLRPRPLSRAERKKLEKEQARAIPNVEPVNQPPVKQINAITNNNINSLTGGINKPSDDLINQTLQAEKDRLSRYYQILARAALLT